VAKNDHGNQPPTMLLTNVRSLLNKYDEVFAVIKQLDSDVVVLTETWLHDRIPDCSLQLDGYTFQRFDRCDSRKGGGILVYSSNHLGPVKVINYSHVEKSEIALLHLENQRLLLMAIYHPVWGAASSHDAALDHITYILTQAICEFSCHKLIIMGDFNDLANHFDAIMRSFQLTNIVKFATRAGKTLDCIFTNIVLPSNFSVNLCAPIAKSDHACVSVSKCVKIDKHLLKFREGKIKNLPDYSPRNRILFSQLMVSFKWDDIINDCSL
jgi:hypothetical protein